MKEPPALVGQAFLYCCGDRFSPAQLCADQRSGHSRAGEGGGLVVRRATRSQGLDGVRGGRGRQGPAAGCSLGLRPALLCQGPNQDPALLMSFSAVLIELRSSWDGGDERGRGNQNPEIAGPPGNTPPGGWGRC